MSNNKIPFVASWLAWSLIAWISMSAAIFGLQHDLAQIIYADAFYRLENGDAKGASDAIAAGMKMTTNFGEQNLSVSAMIRVAIESLFSSAAARLPEGPDALKNLAAEAKTKRQQWLNVTQWECLSLARQLNAEVRSADAHWGGMPIGPLPRALSTRLGNSGLQLFIYDAWLGAADQVEIFQKFEQFAATDLGAIESESAIKTDWAWFVAPDWFRAWLRLNLTLLRCEQANLIRWTRTQMQAGKSGNLGELPSVVIPGSKWVITGAAATNSVSMKLTPAPRWTTENTVIDETFFLLPLEGSKSWTFVNAH